jgi:hypothetical protein
MAFKILDKDGSGEIDMQDIKGVYNAKAHPDVIMERMTEEQVLLGFVQAFESGTNKDGIVTLAEFENYYANISASIDSDDYFELMMRNAWHISGGEGQMANSTNRRVLVTHADGRQSVEEVQNDLGIGANDKQAMIQRLQAQGHNVATMNTNGAGGMGNQTEAKDWAEKRQQMMASASGSGAADRTPQAPTQRVSLATFAAANTAGSSGSGTGSRRPSNSSTGRR